MRAGVTAPGRARRPRRRTRPTGRSVASWRRCARERPLVVVFDDIHWAEPALLDLIEHIADLSRDAPLLLLCMARGELLDVRPAWGGGKLNATTVSLEPLADEECELLIANLLGSAGLPREVAERITGAAEGNPLFVEEMLVMLIDDERLVRSGDSWVAVGELADVAVPPSILALLEARLDRLGRRSAPSSNGPRWSARSSTAARSRRCSATTAPPDLRELLVALVRRELVRPDRSTLPGQETYRFRHQLIRDTAYEGLPKDLRASLHERFAGWLERVAGDRIDEQEEILALPPGAGAPLPAGARSGQRPDPVARRARGAAPVRPRSACVRTRGPRGRGEPPSACGEPAPGRSLGPRRGALRPGSSQQPGGGCSRILRDVRPGCGRGGCRWGSLARVARPHRTVRNSSAHGPSQQGDRRIPGRARAGPRGVRGAR